MRALDIRNQPSSDEPTRRLGTRPIANPEQDFPCLRGGALLNGWDWKVMLLVFGGFVTVLAVCVVLIAAKIFGAHAERRRALKRAPPLRPRFQEPDTGRPIRALHSEPDDRPY